MRFVGEVLVVALVAGIAIGGCLWWVNQANQLWRAPTQRDAQTERGAKPLHAVSL